MHTHTRGTPRTHACMCTHTRVTFRPESKSDLGSCETILRDRLKIESRTRLAYGTRLAYTVYARARTRLRLLVRACADDRTYVRTYIPRIDILPRANALGNNTHQHILLMVVIQKENSSLGAYNVD